MSKLKNPTLKNRTEELCEHANDFDKVIEQLEKVSFIDVDEEYADDGQRMLFLHDAIEIVKKGGAE